MLRISDTLNSTLFIVFSEQIKNVVARLDSQ